jgi:hypothetical protein
MCKRGGGGSWVWDTHTLPPLLPPVAFHRRRHPFISLLQVASGMLTSLTDVQQQPEVTPHTHLEVCLEISCLTYSHASQDYWPVCMNVCVDHCLMRPLDCWDALPPPLPWCVLQLFVFVDMLMCNRTVCKCAAAP